MENETLSWAAILLVATVTFLNRIAGPIMMQFIDTSARVNRFLDAMAVSVIAALVASVLAQGGWREVAAVAIAALITLRGFGAVWAILAGVGTAAIWSMIAGPFT